MSKYYPLLLFVALLIASCRKKEPEDKRPFVNGVWVCTGYNWLEGRKVGAIDTFMQITGEMEIVYTKDSIVVRPGKGYDLGMKYVDMGTTFTRAQYPENIGDIFYFDEYKTTAGVCGSIKKNLVYFADGDSVMFSFSNDTCGKYASFSLNGKRKK